MAVVRVWNVSRVGEFTAPVQAGLSSTAAGKL